MSDLFDWLLCKQQMGHVSLHKKSRGRQRMASEISIQMIMCQPLQSGTVDWLPHRAKYSIYNSNRGALCSGIVHQGKSCVWLSLYSLMT